MYSHCNICNIPIYFCNIYIKQLQHTSETLETLSNIRLQHAVSTNISLLLGRMKARRCVEFTDVNLACGVELATPVEKAVAGPMEKAAIGLHTVRVERELCVGEFHPGHRELCAGELRPSHGELGRRSVRCAWADSARVAVRCTRTSSTPIAMSWAASALGETSAGGRGEHGMSMAFAPVVHRELHRWSVHYVRCFFYQKLR
jgi:hypothetical protein